METIVSLLALGAIYLVSYVMKSLSATSQDEEGAKPVFGEGFPTIEILQPGTEEKTGTLVSAKPIPDVVTARKTAAVTPRPLKVDSPVRNDGKEEPLKRGRLVALSNKSEAKRAFIYSEIFNRKY